MLLEGGGVCRGRRPIVGPELHVGSCEGKRVGSRVQTGVQSATIPELRVRALLGDGTPDVCFEPTKKLAAGDTTPHMLLEFNAKRGLSYAAG